VIDPVELQLEVFIRPTGIVPAKDLKVTTITWRTRIRRYDPVTRIIRGPGPLQSDLYSHVSSTKGVHTVTMFAALQADISLNLTGISGTPPKTEF
jgi:hypothetical protein